MKKYTKHMKKDWYCFFLGPFFMTLEACGEFVLPFISANIINHGAATGDVDYIFKKQLSDADHRRSNACHRRTRHIFLGPRRRTHGCRCPKRCVSKNSDVLIFRH